ncbi:MAG: Glu/Leu/Phe/Val dehydrogenase [Methanomicrobiaceae archaeon]|nr:Glu/Leu/Phe/Val dehydrogenase [Methanomicrobiaceae archaeon]
METNLFESVRENICTCIAGPELTPNLEAVLKMPMKELHISIPVKMDDGNIKTFQGFRIQYNNARGPGKGGIRFHPDETADTIRGLAAIMTLKCALHELPLGGAKGGVVCNPKSMSEGELERLSRAYIQALGCFIGPDRDIPAPDVYTDEKTMGWMIDEYCRQTGKAEFGAITGKPISLGGSEGRHDSTARGGWFCIREAARETGIGIEMKTKTYPGEYSDKSGEPAPSAVIQGFGNVGYNAALIGKEISGCRIIAVSDSRGGILSEEGLDILAVIKHKKKTGSVQNFPETENITNSQLLELKTDVLIPAALENAITEDNADSIDAKILAEFANGPTSPMAESILNEKGIHIIPDILCNGGGVIVSYFEMVQNLNLDHWSEDYIYRRLDEKMTGAYHRVLEYSKKNSIPMRMAAYTIALEKVIDAMTARGWI